MPKPYLPANIQRELDSAIDRTGVTPALALAMGRLPAVLKLTPMEFEQTTAILYLTDKPEV